MTEQTALGGGETDLFAADVSTFEPAYEPGPANLETAPEPQAEEESVPPPVSDNAALQLHAKKFVFQSLLEKASSVLPSKDIMPVLKNFQVEAVAGRLRVVATDLELSVISTTEMVMVQKTGIAVFPGRKMLDIIREAEDGDMTVTVADGIATVEVGRTKWDLKLESGSDYPPLPEIADVELHQVNRVRFLGAIQSVRYAATTESNRPSLMMINVARGKMTACDGVRFQQASLGDDFPLDIQLPIGAVDDLVKLLRSSELDDIGIGESDFHLVFRVGADVFIANKLMAQFPDVEALLLRPALENKDQFHVDRSELQDAVKRVRITADPETSAILLQLTSGSITIASKDKFGNQCQESIDADWKLGDRSIVVNHSFLSDMLNMYDGKSCLFRLGTDTKTRKSPVLLEDKDTETYGIINQMRQDWVL